MDRALFRSSVKRADVGPKLEVDVRRNLLDKSRAQTQESTGVHACQHVCLH